MPCIGDVVTQYNSGKQYAVFIKLSKCISCFTKKSNPIYVRRQTTIVVQPVKLKTASFKCIISSSWIYSIVIAHYITYLHKQKKHWSKISFSHTFVKSKLLLLKAVFPIIIQLKRNIIWPKLKVLKLHIELVIL